MSNAHEPTKYGPEIWPDVEEARQRRLRGLPPEPVEPGSSAELDAETADAFARVARDRR